MQHMNMSLDMCAALNALFPEVTQQTILQRLHYIQLISFRRLTKHRNFVTKKA
jgi:hypothetical protein